MATLTVEEKAAYENNGYVVPAYRLPEAKLAGLIEALETVIEANPNVRPERLVSVHLCSHSKSAVKGHSAFLDIALDDELLDLVAGVLGSNFALWGCQIFCKPGSDGMQVPMHQDGQYWPIRPLATCTVWLAIDPSNRDNGCLSVIPGSHRARVHYNHVTRRDSNLVLNQAVEDPRVADLPPDYVELEPGQLSMHDVYLVHGSEANTSGNRRGGVAIRYMPTSSWFRRDIEMPFSGYPVEFANRPVWLARGQDLCGKNDFETGHADPQCPPHTSTDTVSGSHKGSRWLPYE